MGLTTAPIWGVRKIIVVALWEWVEAGVPFRGLLDEHPGERCGGLGETVAGRQEDTANTDHNCSPFPLPACLPAQITLKI